MKRYPALAVERTRESSGSDLAGDERIPPCGMDAGGGDGTSVPDSGDHAAEHAAVETAV